MKSSRYCRLVCRPARLAAVPSRPSPVSIPSLWRLSQQGRLQHDSSSGASIASPASNGPRNGTAPSRFAVANEVDEEQSAFKTQRRNDLAEDQKSDDPLFPESYPRLPSDPQRMSIEEFRDRWDNLDKEEVILTGRVRSKRVLSKKLIFVDIVNDFHRVQVMISQKKSLPTQARSQRFDMFRHLIQVGDHISVSGQATLSSTGELTLEASKLPELLSPAMEQIPDKLVDPKTRSEERHLDMLVNKEVTDVLRLRAAITKHLRDYFHSNKFLEVQTPILANKAGGAIARPFTTRATEFKDKDLALRIAPELWLKRLVVGGMDKVFEIGQSFRNEGIDGTHNPEFTTCEFYSAYSNLADLIQQTEEIIKTMATECQKLIESDLTALPSIDVARFEGHFQQIEFLPGLEEAMGIRLPNLASGDALPELLAVLKLAGIDLPGETPNSLHKLLDRLAAMYLEPKSFEKPLFITNHPVCMSPLAKGFLCPRTYQLVSARAELFIGGRELANMYEEENDPEEQKRKMSSYRSLVREQNGHPEESAEDAVAEEVVENVDDEAPPVDQSYIRALDYGLPPTGGWGCGVERLVMLFSGSERISDCLSFGTLRNVVSQAGEKNKDS